MYANAHERARAHGQVDALSPHVREATTAVCLGSNVRSYTDHAKLLKARGHGGSGRAGWTGGVMGAACLPS